ncbi:hypothetical protein GUJ93_ZPchr0007g4467 [Zizania palustris]|uniref:Uncharacterized protein n=1 Tax=Zizania palustris TaxID=103762 RepID=A0A8J5SJM7_ZIZPA|nr:hypothetical protein GUJ93_ZPchr0007g4467 [Zizania palustris]
MGAGATAAAMRSAARPSRMLPPPLYADLRRGPLARRSGAHPQHRRLWRGGRRADTGRFTAPRGRTLSPGLWL